MERRQLSLYTLISKLGDGRWDKNEFDNRLFIQKAIYLAQLFGFDLKYRFSWYKRGPYSRLVTADVYEIYESEEEEKVALPIRKEYESRLDELKKLLDSKPDSVNKQEEWSELLSSIHYIKHISKPTANITSDTIMSDLHDSGKSGFDESAVDEAWNKLSEIGLIENKVLAKPTS